MRSCLSNRFLQVVRSKGISEDSGIDYEEYITYSTYVEEVIVSKNPEYLDELLNMIDKPISSHISKLLEDSTVTSSDFNSVKALVNGELDTFLGFKFHVLGTRAEGGLPGVVSDREAYAYHKSAIGLAIGMDMKTTIDWVAQKTSWLANGMFKAGCVAREAQGVVKIQYDEGV